MKLVYTPLFDRVKAAFIDSLILIATMYIASEVFLQFENMPNYVRIIVSVMIFLLYDPILTTSMGGTIGHSFIGFSVRKESNEAENISFISALFRFLVKVSLGWISLLTITGNSKKRALHDLFVGSVVINL